MPRKPSPEPSPRSWIESWLRLLSPTDNADGLAGRVVAGLRLAATCSVLLAFVVTVWAALVMIAGGAWHLLSDGRLGATLMSLFSGAGIAAGGAYYRRRMRQRDDRRVPGPRSTGLDDQR
jgi:hypothetical protein